MNEVKEVMPPVATEPTEIKIPKLKRAYRKRKVEEALKEVFPAKTFVRIETTAPRAEPVKTGRREAALPDPKWMAEFVRALLGGV
jgi:hypothetical protein